MRYPVSNPLRVVFMVRNTQPFFDVHSWKVHKALIEAKLEPYLGFLHSVQYGKPSLVCDFMELYRYLIDDFLIEYCRNLKPKDFIGCIEYSQVFRICRKLEMYLPLQARPLKGTRFILKTILKKQGSLVFIYQTLSMFLGTFWRLLK